jgi:hypothetical protein
MRFDMTARHLETITSLQASHDPQVPIQFWQLFSVFGPEPIVGIVAEFY